MVTKRRRSLLDDDDLAVIDDERDESSGGDVCDECDCPRVDHDADGCKCGKCSGFKER